MVMHLPSATRCFRRFHRKKTAFVSFCILTVLYLVSFAAELIANDKPILISYNRKLYFFAAYCSYPETMFGGIGESEPDYKALAETARFTDNKSNFIIFPLIPCSLDTRYPDQPASGKPIAPCSRHLFGSDTEGRDVLALIIYGFRTSITLALVLLALEIVIGMTAGAIRAYSGRVINFVTRGFTDFLSALPVFFIVMLAGDLFGGGCVILVTAISLFKWIGFSQYTGTWFSRIRKCQFPDAARISGAGRIKIFFAEILPNLVFPIISFAPFSMASSISLLTGLDFLGYGLPAPGWGGLLGQGSINPASWWLLVFPLCALFITLLLLAFIGEGLRESLDQENCRVQD